MTFFVKNGVFRQKWRFSSKIQHFIIPNSQFLRKNFFTKNTTFDDKHFFGKTALCGKTFFLSRKTFFDEIHHIFSSEMHSFTINIFLRQIS